MKKSLIDINCDVGEGIGNEAALFRYISSCNIACGGHAGDLNEMQRVTSLAYENNILIGAHPSYPDRENFGRISMDISSNILIRSIRTQIEELTTILKAQNVSLHHIKPHGALYNDIIKDQSKALIFLEAIAQYKSEVKLYVPYGSAIAREAQIKGFQYVYEAFGDRNYNEDLTLVSRKSPNALIEEPALVLQHLITIINEQQVRTITGENVMLLADTYCIHGDTPSALQILTYLSHELPKYDIVISQ